MTSKTYLKARGCALSLVALLGAPAAAASAQKVSPLVPVKGVATAVRLPGGDDVEWRSHLTDWSSVPDAAPTIVETVSAPARAGMARARLFVSSGYGWRNDPVRGGQRRHEGIDLPGRLGSRVYATGPGIVSFAGWARGYGNLVQLDHSDGLRTRYGHLSQILVSRGEFVSQGEVVGHMGSTGRSTGSHLHYEVRVGGVPVNPFAFIGTAASVPHYDVQWPQVREVAARWLGWDKIDDRSRLPEAQIR